MTQAEGENKMTLIEFYQMLRTHLEKSDSFRVIRGHANAIRSDCKYLIECEKKIYKLELYEVDPDS